MEITELLAFAQKNKSSDLHLVAGKEPMVRIDGSLRPVKTGDLDADTVKTMIYSIMTEEQRSEFESEKEIDLAISFGTESRFRVNAYTTTTGAAAAFREIPTKIPTLEQINAPEIFKKFAETERGLVLVTGPTGSGKSTTLAAMIDYMNANTDAHILTVEDPVEFVHGKKRALINHREVGKHTKSFTRALKSALREDPDVILVGEMRDHETISLALTAAETGHLVMGTLHTSSAAKTVDRIIDVFPAGDKEMVRSMIAGSLQAVISQVLLKRKGGGRAAAHEIMVGTSAVRNLIRENKVPQIYSMIQVGQRYGMQTMDDSMRALVEKGIVEPEEVGHMLAKLSDAGPPAAPAGGAESSAPRPAPAAATAPTAASAEPRKSRSLF
ncbi:MAG: type IV pilus twitching motility protein PilT [Rhodospirillaceae bacterium]|nr:MAG: type IV pilus twitching motility protein PilT [Rhodospirillaceae bacterium]